MPWRIVRGCIGAGPLAEVTADLHRFDHECREDQRTKQCPAMNEAAKLQEALLSSRLSQLAGWP
jgi:hypothetical protein